MTPSQLIKIRIALDMTQAALAEEFEISRQHVSAMENGHKRIVKTTVLSLKWIMLVELDHDTRMDLLRDIKLR